MRDFLFLDVDLKEPCLTLRLQIGDLEEIVRF